MTPELTPWHGDVSTVLAEADRYELYHHDLASAWGAVAAIGPVLFLYLGPAECILVGLGFEWSWLLLFDILAFVAWGVVQPSGRAELHGDLCEAWMRVRFAASELVRAGITQLPPVDPEWFRAGAAPEAEHAVMMRGVQDAVAVLHSYLRSPTAFWLARADRLLRLRAEERQRRGFYGWPRRLL